MNQKKIVKFLGFWGVNIMLLSIFSTIFAGDVVLGNAYIVKPVATIVNSLFLAIAIYLVPEALKKLDLKIKVSDEKVLVVGYFLANFALLWILKRLAVITGIGMTSLLNVLVVAIVLAILQIGIEKYSAKLLKKN